MITYPYRLAAPPGSTATQLNPLSTRAELKHSSSPRSILSKQGGFVSHEGRRIPLCPCQRKHYYCLPMPWKKKKENISNMHIILILAVSAWNCSA